MIKKYLNIFMCIGLLMQNFIFIIPVNAEELEEPFININGIYQGNKIAEVDTEGNYIIDTYDAVKLDFKLENIDMKKDYYVKIEHEYGASGYTYNNQIGFKETLYLDNPSEDNGIYDYDIKICDDWDCNKIYTTKKITLKLNYFNKIKDSMIIIKNITQGGKKASIEESETTKIKLNNKQNIKYTLIGKNLIDNADYKITGNSYLNDLIVKGSELEEGINLEHHINLENNSSTFVLRIELNDIQISVPLKYFDGTNTHDYFFIEINEDNNLPSYSTELFYTNYKNEEIKKSNIEYANYYIIDSKYHNKDKTLSLNIKGNNYKNEDYLVTIEIKKDKETYYKKEEKINGLLLNNSYNLELKDLLLELNKEEEFNAKTYDFYIEIDNVRTKQEYKYNSIGKDVRILSNIFFENGKKNLSAFRGDGSSFFGSGIYDTNKDVFTKYSSVYLRYMGENFNDDEIYQYVLEYGNYIENEDSYKREYEEKLKKGEIKGSVLNTVGLLFQVNNNKNYENPTYKLTIKKDDEILYSDSPILFIVDSPTLANASLKANNKNLYLQTSDLSYIATRNAPIEAVISGLGFKDNKDYEFTFCYYKNYLDEEWDENNEKCEKITFKGKELNNGTAKIKLKEKIDEKAISYNFYVMCDLKESFMENVAIQGGFDVTFVDSKELFPNLTKYYVDNVEDLIKDISKNTSVEDFANNIDVKDNGKIKVYDKTGKNEIKGNIGTGMIARVVNEYDENILDLDVVVKGDVSGDGNISITDLVKVKRHLSEEEKLTSVYEIAGNITGTGEIGITDLVKISRDVAKIQEVE